MKIEKILKEMVERNASDLYLKVGSVPFLRIDGRPSPQGESELTLEQIKTFADQIMNEAQKRQFQNDQDIDFSFSMQGIGRFRTSVFWQRGNMGMVLRPIKTKIPSFQELNLPADVFQRLSLEKSGLILITGAAGSGKSTALASMIDYINTNCQKHIVTIEDPIEFIHENKKAIINQREIGSDTRSYNQGLRHALRQSPDVILIGEILNLEMMRTVLSAAETGHLILSTLHTINAVQTLERIVGFFPSHQHQEIRMQLSLLLKGVISLRLLPRKDVSGRIPACEVMLSTPTIRKLILEGKTGEISEFIKDGALEGMKTFNQALLNLYKEDRVSLKDARENADNQEEFDLSTKGIYSGRDTHQMPRGRI